jgi:RimJ/RimL family protein N-acetyltransferase
MRLALPVQDERAMTIFLPARGTGSETALRLRPWRSEDRPALIAAHRDPMLRRWLSSTLTDDAEAEQWLAAQAAGWAAATRFSFAVVTGPDDGSPVGHVVVKAGDGEVAEVGYWTAPAARRQGVAARALETASQWALEDQEMVRLTRLNLMHAIGNQASCRVAVKCGYPLHDLLPAAPPAFPASGHRHVRTARVKS